MSEETIFTKIANHEAEADILFEDDDLVVFKDIRPKAPVHVLVVPRKPIENLAAVTEEDQALLGKLMYRASLIAKELGVAESGYKIVINTGDDGGQIVPHLHLHVLGGETIKALV
jgi:histidine triad (HIT) family protein